MTGTELLAAAVEEQRGKDAAQRICKELKTPMAILACTLDMVLTVKAMEHAGFIPKGLSEKAQAMAEDVLRKEGLL